MTVTSSKPAPDALSAPDPSESQHAEAIADRVKAQTAQPVQLQSLHLADPFRWLQRGLKDVRAAPGQFGLCFSSGPIGAVGSEGGGRQQSKTEGQLAQHREHPCSMGDACSLAVYGFFVGCMGRTRKSPAQGGACVLQRWVYKPAAARRSAALSVFSQVKVVKVSSPTVTCSGVRPKWP